MSSFMVHVLNDEGTPEDCFLTPQSVARFMAPPKNLVVAGQIPALAKTIVVDPYGTALPVLEAPGQIAALLAMTTQPMWFCTSSSNAMSKWRK